MERVPEKLSDRLLLGLPLLSALVLNLILSGGILIVQHFDLRFSRETDASLMQKANLTTAHVKDKLAHGELEKVKEYCKSFDNRVFRLTLVSPDGIVLADSLPGSPVFDNHSERSEVKSVLSRKTNAFSRRYSGTESRTMLYYAVPVEYQGKTYALRMSVPLGPYQTLSSAVTLCIAALMALSVLLLGGLQIYLVRRVYCPLNELRNGAGRILNGNLDSFIPVPTHGIVRELAQSVSRMTELLKKRLLEASRERNEKNMILDTMSEGVLLFASDGTLIRYNSSARLLFDFIGGDRFDLARCQIPELLTLSHRMFDGGEPFEREFTLRREGVERSLFVKGRILEDNGVKELLLTVTELTNLHRLESFRSDFVANVSHEIKTPLTCIVGAVEALEDEIPPGGASGRLLEMLKSQSARLNNLVRDILSLASLEKQQLDSGRSFAPTEFDSVLINAKNLCAHQAAASGVSLVLGVHEAIAGNADSRLVEQALVNLIVNALKYSGGKRIVLSLRRDRGNAVFEISDDGIGIAPEHAKRIFERFYRVDKSRSRELGGTGLGLAIVKHIAQLHHGSAELESEPGKGCRFRIVIPVG